jgi:hypothetical protein
LRIEIVQRTAREFHAAAKSLAPADEINSLLRQADLP